MSQNSIRLATVEDTPLILSFIQDLAEYEKLAHQVVATEQKLIDTLFSSAPAAEVVIVESDGEPAGFALFFHNYSTFLAQKGLYLEDLFVLPAHRNKGLGKLLLSYLANLAVARGCGRFEWSVLDWNQPAIDFYQSQGAKLMHDWRITRLTGAELQALAAQYPH